MLMLKSINRERGAKAQGEGKKNGEKKRERF